jgi:hypothetical protein
MRRMHAMDGLPDIRRILIAVTSALLLHGGGALAQPEEIHETGVLAQAGQNAEAQTPQIEEIVVSGELTSSRLLFQVDRAQDEVYRLFNELLDDSEFRITCARRAPTGSYIIERHCQPVFMSDAMARESAQTISAWRSGEEQETVRSMGNALSGRTASRDLQFDLAHKYEQMNQKMFALANDNPQLLAALQRFAQLREQYDVMIAEEQRAPRRRR